MLNTVQLRYWLFFVFIPFPALAFSQLSIDSCQEKAKNNYPLIKQYDLISKSTEYTISNANKAYLPQVSLNGIGAYFLTDLPSLGPPSGNAPATDKFQFIGIAQVNQTIWDGGATRTQKNITKAGAEVESANVDVALHAIKERVNQLYFGILLMDEQLSQLSTLQETLNRNLNAVTLSKNNGLAYQTDVDELKAEVINLEQRKIEFTYTRKGYIEMLSYLIGQPLSEDTHLMKHALSDYALGLPNKRPELLLYANQRKLAIAQSSMDRVYNMPKVGLLGAGVLIQPGINFGSTTFNSLAVAGLSVSWNVSGLYKTSNNNKLNKIKLDKIANQEEAFRFTTNLQLKQTGTDIEKQKAILQKDREIVELKTSIRKGYELKYENGVSSMNDLINAINKESEAQNQEALHEVQLLMSMYQYQTITGN